MPFYLRKTPRLWNFDYAETYYYFVTVCTHEKKCIFGMEDTLTDCGKIAYNDLCKLPEYYNGVVLDQFVVMLNHIHAIIGLKKKQQFTNLPAIIGAYKAGVSRKIHQLQPTTKVWQRSFHDHVIRNHEDYENIWNYIRNNPEKWKEDCFYHSQA